ncbi:endonuclease [Arenibacter sp. TNZ]|uniref:NUMOD1 domain-containing DNA-binding protein n=1 Tax=Arenibacter TaxID=178469 RepID=UPI000CD412BB|nr:MULTISPECIES: NUMOD1 domain-containing DNA-binding protein [Arenibacter]MCM4172453.1 endonuclease [Arenibacter sp. TNZ]
MSSFGLVYKAVNRETQEVYIGATTKSIKERIVDHINKASRLEGSNFQSAIATYGADAFSWVEIDTANDINELAKKEKDFILKYDSFKNGLNSDSGGGFKKMVYQFDLKGNLISEYDSLTSAASVTGVTNKRISNACLSKTHLLDNNYWSYNENFTIDMAVDDRKKFVCQNTLNGEFIIKYVSVAEASRISGISKTCISRCCRGEREQTGGFLWKYT